MELTLNRDVLKNEFTLGELSIDGKFFCYTVEDVVRSGAKVHGKTAIPYGRYKVILNMSNRFKKIMPLLIDVPQFEGIRIHAGNTALDTEGCLIVGMVRTGNGVGMSRVAYTKLMEKLSKESVIYITIK